MRSNRPHPPHRRRRVGDLANQHGHHLPSPRGRPVFADLRRQRTGSREKSRRAGDDGKRQSVQLHRRHVADRRAANLSQTPPRDLRRNHPIRGLHALVEKDLRATIRRGIPRSLHCGRLVRTAFHPRWRDGDRRDPERVFRRLRAATDSQICPPRAAGDRQCHQRRLVQGVRRRRPTFRLRALPRHRAAATDAPLRQHRSERCHQFHRLHRPPRHRQIPNSNRCKRQPFHPRLATNGT